jgi:hypothetical protein
MEIFLEATHLYHQNPVIALGFSITDQGISLDLISRKTNLSLGIDSRLNLDILERC